MFCPLVNVCVGIALLWDVELGFCGGLFFSRSPSVLLVMNYRF